MDDCLWKYHKTSKNVWTGEWCYKVISKMSSKAVISGVCLLCTKC